MNKPSTFKQTDLQRAIKGVQGCGLPVEGVEITKDGTIRVLTSKAEKLEKRPEPRL